MAGPDKTAVRFSLFGLALVTIGILFLLHNFKVISWDIWSELWKFWPVVLVIIGINFLWGQSRTALVSIISVVLLIGSIGAAALIAGRATAAEPVTYSQALSGITKAEIEVNFGAGDLTVGKLAAASGNLVETTAQPDMRHEFFVRNTTGSLSLNVPAGYVSNPANINLNALLSQEIPIRLTIKTGASHADIDLTGLKVYELAMDIGASSLDLRFPADAGKAKAEVKAGAASINISIPQNIPARIQVSAGLSSVHVDSRFIKSGTAYQSADYSESAANTLDLTISAGISSINIR